MGDRYVKLDGNKRNLLIKVNKLNRWASFLRLAYNEIEMWRNYPDC